MSVVDPVEPIGSGIDFRRMSASCEPEKGSPLRVHVEDRVRIERWPGHVNGDVRYPCAVVVSTRAL